MKKTKTVSQNFFKDEMPEDLYELLYNPETLYKLNENFKQEREECSKIIEQIRTEKIKPNEQKN